MQQLPDVHALSWAAMNIAHQEQFGNVLGLIYVILSLPGRQLMLRGFSQLKLTRSTIRLNLSGQLIDLMTVQMMSLLIEVFGVPTVLTHNHWAIDRVMTLTAAMCHMLTAVFPTQTLVRTHLD